MSEHEVSTDQILQFLRMTLPDTPPETIDNVLRRAAVRVIMDQKIGMKCFPGFRIIRWDQDYDPGITYYRLIYVFLDGTSRRLSTIALPDEIAEDFAKHFGSCECHTS